MRIGQKIALGFLPVGILFALAGAMHIAHLNQTREQIDQVISINLAELEWAEEVFNATQVTHSTIMRVLLDSQYKEHKGHTDHISQAFDSINDSLDEANTAISSLEKATLHQISHGDPEGENDELREIQQLKIHVNDLSNLAGQLEAHLDAGNYNAARTIANEQVLPISLAIQALVSDLEVDAREEVDTALDEARSDTETSILASIIVSMAAALTAIGLGLYLSRSISSNVSQMHEATTRLERGELDTRIEIDSSDELGQIAADINRMAIGLRETIVSRDDLAKEIEKRISVQKELQKNESKFRAIFESSKDSFSLLDNNGFLDCNDATLKMFKISSRKEFLGHHPSELSPATQSDGTPSIEAAGRHIETALNVGYDQFEWIHMRKSGEEFPAEVLLTRLVIDGENLLMASVRDITERKLRDIHIRESEVSLRAHQEEIRLLLNSTAEAIYGVDTGGNCTMVNKSCIDMLGYSSESELIGKNMHELIHHSHKDGSPLAAINCRIFQAFNNAKATHVDDEVFWRKDGSNFPVSYWSHPIYKKESVIGAVVTFLDISEQVSSRSALKQSRELLQTALEGTIAAVAKSVEARDPYTAGHQRRVADLASAIAGEMGLDANQVKGVFLSATIHDIGKIQMPADILSKPGKLSYPEFELIKAHSEAGYNILKDVKFPWPVADVAHQHHERIDGSGYPQGLKGDEICLEARIVAVADVVEAMSSHRPYRAGLGIDIALEEIRIHRGSSFDPVVVDACLKLFEEKGYTLQA
ncbi:PAS domain S-box-containing protein/HDIG domain-containing protein [Mariprofundus aestuarium]|uniref:PAS domain S-box-containing protein/HDIG domain-containing protein n=1 Tax=Mariprofundus aestuarium TaxID=1921086 RepID=A0A2K8L0R2_MARES|nr:HD domain-containing phosphohydrolase [Mariprofundus aestuarium]ATX80867.1 PAS domain S-box-containing protein/HDIG domain-containing protein [Mariprofundus aestuarium]